MTARGWGTLFYKEVLRFRKVFLQTLLAPMVTSLLYLLIFAQALAAHVEAFPHVSYTSFLVPGLIMMAMIQNAFANSSSSLIQSKMTGNLVFLLVTPLSPAEVLLAFTLAAVTRALIVGVGILIVTGILVPLPLHSIGLVLLFAFLSSAALGVLGLIAAVWSEKFEQLAGFQNFIVVPLSFLSGVFYSIHSLPDFWQQLSHLNPFFYMIDGFRYGFFGVADVPPAWSLAVVALTLSLLCGIAWEILRRGYKLRD